MTHQQSPGTAPILTDEDRDERSPEAQTFDGEVVDPTATPTREVDPPTQTPTQTGPVDPDPTDPTDPDPDTPPDPDDPVPAPAATATATDEVSTDPRTDLDPDHVDPDHVDPEYVDTDPETAAAEADREATAPRPEPVDAEVVDTVDADTTVDTDTTVDPDTTVDTEMADTRPEFDREAELTRDATLEPSAATIEADTETADTDRDGVPDEAVEHAPGEVEQSPVADLWPAAVADALRARWRELQLRFVDDPQGAAAEADAVAAEAVEALTSTLNAQRTELAQWRTDRDADTEGLRVAVQRYHAFLDRVLGL